MAFVKELLRRAGYVKQDDLKPSVRIIDSREIDSALGRATWSGEGYRSYALNAYARNSDVFACISLIATAAKQVKWWAGDESTSPKRSLRELAALVKSREWMSEFGDRDEKLRKAVDPSASLKLLASAQPGGASLIEWWTSYILLSGNSYIEQDRNAAGLPVQLWLIRPDRIAAEEDRTGRHAAVARWRISSPSGSQRLVSPGEVTHSKLFSPVDDIYGMSPIQAAMLQVDAQSEGMALQKRLMQRGHVVGWLEAQEPHPDSGVVVKWDDESRARLKEQVDRAKEGRETLFLEYVKWHEAGFRPDESGVDEHRILSKRDVASVFHVPAELIGDSTTKNYANAKDARRGLYSEATIPLLTQFRDDWNRTIGTMLGSPLEFDKDAFDSIVAAREANTDRVIKAWQAGLIDHDEARAELEYDPAKSGQVFYAPATYVPLGSDTELEPAE